MSLLRADEKVDTFLELPLNLAAVKQQGAVEVFIIEICCCSARVFHLPSVYTGLYIYICGGMNGRSSP